MAKKLPKSVMLERRRMIWDMRQKFMTHEAIGQQLGISQQAVSKVLRLMTKKYAERHMEDIDRIKAEQVAELEHVAYEAYQAWDRSKEASKMVRKKSLLSGASEQVLESRDNDGDPRYLQIAMKAKEDIRKIVGADAPLKVDARYSGLDDLSDDELRKRALEALNEGIEKDSDGNDSAPSANEEPMETASRPADTSLF